MMWLRRVLAIILAIIFIVLFIPMLVAFRVNGTVGNPHFYTDRLRQADIYNFIYDDALPSAIEEAKTDLDIPEDFKSLIEPRIIPVFEQALPQAWLQAQVEQAITEVLPYALGDTRGFTINIPLKDRIEACAQAVKDVLNDEGLFSDLYDQSVNFALDKIESNLKDTPFNREQLKTLMNTALPAQWVLTQINSAIDEVIPYFTGDKEHFTLHLDVSDRLDDLEKAVVDILKSPETYNYVFEKLLVPTLEENIQGVTELPLGIVLTADEIIDVAEKVMTLDWYQLLVPQVTQPVFSYLKGTTPDLTLIIPLADRKPIAVAALIEIANEKAGMDVSDVTSSVLNSLMNDWIPDQWILDEVLTQLPEDINIEDKLLKVREYIEKGIDYTDDDLRSDMKENYQTVEDIRQKTAEGFVFTEQDLQDMMNKDNNAQMPDFDKIRHLLGTVRRWMPAAWLVPALILLAIGALGARKWLNKLVWGASVLALTSLLVFVISLPVYSAIVKPELNKALEQAVGQTQDGWQTLIADKGISIAQDAANSFIGGLRVQAIILLVVSLALIAFAVVWNKVKVRAPPSE